jgi:hypothetical protein
MAKKVNKNELVPYAYQCPECLCILEIPCFDDGCPECDFKGKFDTLYIEINKGVKNDSTTI